MKKIIFILVVLMLVSGCTIKIRDKVSHPGSNLIDTVPVIKYGSNNQNEIDDYVIYYPKGEEIPFTSVMRGSLFAKAVQVKSMVILTKDIYTYKNYWVSYDGENWFKHTDLLEYGFYSGLPEDGGFLSQNISISIKGK